MKTCPALRAPAHGRMKCEHDEDYQHQFEEDSTVYPIDTRCQFRCNLGYQIRGSKVRNCLPLSRWDGLKVTCKGKIKSILICNVRYVLTLMNVSVGSRGMRASAANRERKHHPGNLYRHSEGVLRHQLHDYL